MCAGNNSANVFKNNEFDEFIFLVILQTTPAPPLEKEGTRMYYSMRIYIIFNKQTYYVSAYDICAASPPFPKEGQGWFVIFIELTLKIYHYM